MTPFEMDEMEARKAVTAFNEAISSDLYEKAQKKILLAERRVESATAALASVLVRTPHAAGVIGVLFGDLMLAKKKLEWYEEFTKHCRERIEAAWELVKRQAYWKSVSESIEVDEDFDEETLRILMEESENTARAWASGYAWSMLRFEVHRRAWAAAWCECEDGDGDEETEMLMHRHEAAMECENHNASRLWDELCGMRIWK